MKEEIVEIELIKDIFFMTKQVAYKGDIFLKATKKPMGSSFVYVIGIDGKQRLNIFKNEAKEIK